MSNREVGRRAKIKYASSNPVDNEQANMIYTIISTDWQRDKASLSDIREQVFIQEQQVPVADEWDNHDETATHFLVRNQKGKAIACARLLLEKNSFHIGRVAVLKEYRQQHIGRKLMHYMLNWCKNTHPEFSIYLHAQTHRINFYQHMGFVSRGDIFMDAGIPHIEMWFNQ